jgi:6-phosphogluconolactonase
MLTIDPKKIQSFDDRRDIAIPGDLETTARFAAEHWISTASDAIARRSRFAVAISGGSTPQIIYRLISSPPYIDRLDWSKVYLFWSDERSVPPDHPDSNYRQAMQSGLSRLPLSPSQIFRMPAERELSAAAEEYESLIRKNLGPSLFDLVMLGVGEDGHVASLFPNSPALALQDRLVAANEIAEKKTFRMTLTLPCINQSWRPVLYVWGSNKEFIVKNALEAPRQSPWPASRIGSHERKALWILDFSAANLLMQHV